MMKRVLDRLSTKAVGRLASLALVIATLAAGFTWEYYFLLDLVEGRADAAYRFHPDGSAEFSVEVDRRNLGATPRMHVEFYEGGDSILDTLRGYGSRGERLEWRADQVGDPPLWRYRAMLPDPVQPGQRLRYTVLNPAVRPQSVERAGARWGIFRDDSGIWTFRNHPGLGRRNTVTLMLPEGAEVVEVEPPTARVFTERGRCPVVRFTNLREAHVVRWRA